MKRLISVIAMSIFSLSVIAQDYGSKTQNDSKITSTYCAMLMDGKIMLTAEGRQIYADVKLADGTIVKTDCSVQKSDKTQINLKNGDCIDQDGNIIPADKKRNEKDKMKEKEKDKK